MNMRTQFITWYFNEFQGSKLFTDMVATVEDSPWHREGNVGIHTNMVVSQYLALNNDPDWTADYSKANRHTNLLGAFACAFHDVGKPSSLERKYSEERGHYNAFNGHEPVSARLWENWAVENWEMLKDRFLFSPIDIYIVGWMVENHLPWGLKKEHKLDNLALTITRNEIHNTFHNVLMADTRGRISDDYDTKVAKSQAWVDQMKTRVRNVGMEYLARPKARHESHLVLAVGVSGAGKSTVYRNQYSNYEHFSWDDLRAEYTEENLGFADGLSDAEKAQIAFDYTNEKRSEFSRFWQKHFMDLVKAGKSVYVDNTNLSRKRRQFFLEAVKKRDYNTTAILFPITVEEAIARQDTRGDKSVPAASVIQQYMALQYPWYGEVEEIIVKM